MYLRLLCRLSYLEVGNREPKAANAGSGIPENQRIANRRKAGLRGPEAANAGSGILLI